MKIRNKILLVVLVVLLSSGIFINLTWYRSSNRMTDRYLTEISGNTMRDAYQAFEYLLTDTSYMVTMISLNEKNIVRPVKNLREKELRTANGQWNMEYLNNKRKIMDFISGMNGYKYYIVGITVMESPECSFSTSSLIRDYRELYQRILQMDQEKLKTEAMVMDPILTEKSNTTLSGNCVLPVVRAIQDPKRQVIGYVVLYFDYRVIENMFSSNLPEGSLLQVTNQNQDILFSNCGDTYLSSEDPQKGYVYSSIYADSVDWDFTMAIPSDYYIKDIQETVFKTIVMMGILLFIASLLVIYVVSRITAQISNLKNTMHQISKGDLSVRYKGKSRDEIGQIGHTFNHMVGHIQDLMSKIAKEEEQKKLVEIAFLEAQINPHFISNVLNNVAWMAKLQHADNIVPLIQSLNSLLQNVMHQEKDMIPLSDELDYLDNYLRVVEYSGNYDFILEKEIDPKVEKLPVLRFILQPIFENAIYHGLPQSLDKEGKIKITACVREEKLILTVEDNGTGMTQEQIHAIQNEPVKDRKHFNGIGIPNVRERIELFFGPDYGLHYESEIGSYTRAVFTLPVLPAEGEAKGQEGIQVRRTSC